jgi:hypothetical protein
MRVLESAPYYLNHGALIVVRGKAYNNNGWAVLWSDPNTRGSEIIASAPMMNPPTVVNESPTQITVAWSNPSTFNPQTGVSVNSLPIGTKYELMWDGGLGTSNQGLVNQGQGIWTDLYVGLDTQYTVPINTNLGRNFRFKVRAHSECGWGGYSSELVVDIDTAPGPIDILTSIEGCSVRISWPTPFNGGLPITNYKIEISTNPN